VFPGWFQPVWVTSMYDTDIESLSHLISASRSRDPPYPEDGVGNLR
jgi:hypothetical protein